MPNTNNQTKRFIKKYPETFSIKNILIGKSPTKTLKIAKIIFYFSFVIMGVINFNIETSMLTSNILLGFSVICEIIYLILFKKWLNANTYYHDLINIEYFLKNKLYLKNDYFIMYGKITDYKKTKYTNKTNFFSKKNNTIFSACILLLITTLISNINNINDFLISNIQKMNIKLIILIIIFLILPAYTMYTIESDFKSKKYEAEEALKDIEHRFFDRKNGKFNIELLIVTFYKNKTKHQFVVIEKYISRWQTNKMPK
ncbi:hypothetical protein LCIT_01350 [Leuconostoc citreum]|uniref:Uncharacterized protein n=1 Tax=Leuconostoc citreum TaxID=33964 RepID=A0A5A5TZ90_LEUCI|nr:hypothetical protein [Leuconostoc citreum]GDZ82893.1 hypothetical protein LCIT_01350 [Leuconostoc citreum]